VPVQEGPLPGETEAGFHPPAETKCSIRWAIRPYPDARLLFFLCCLRVKAKRNQHTLALLIDAKSPMPCHAMTEDNENISPLG